MRMRAAMDVDGSHKTSAVTSKLLKREDERVSLQLSKRAEKLESQITEETTEFFKEKFSGLQQELERKLNDIPNLDQEKKSSCIEELLGDLNSLQKLLTDSTHFLSQYSIKAAQGTIGGLRKSIDETKSQCLPKKKFGFRTKVTKSQNDNVDQAKDIPRVPKQKFSVLLESNSLTIENIKDSEVIKCKDELHSKDIILSNLSNCKLKLMGSASAVHVHRISGCQVFIGPVSGSILIEDCINCIFVAACQQMRIHKTTQSKFYVHVTSRAIIEECHDLKFAPFLWSYDGLEQDFEASTLDKSRNNWDLVEDFDWLVPGAPSPNWSILPDNERTLT